MNDFEGKIEKHKRLISKFNGSLMWRKYEALNELARAYSRMGASFKNIDYVNQYKETQQRAFKYLAMGLLFDRTHRTINGW